MLDASPLMAPSTISLFPPTRASGAWESQERSGSARWKTSTCLRAGRSEPTDAAIWGDSGPATAQARPPSYAAWAGTGRPEIFSWTRTRVSKVVMNRVSYLWQYGTIP